MNTMQVGWTLGLVSAAALAGCSSGGWKGDAARAPEASDGGALSVAPSRARYAIAQPAKLEAKAVSPMDPEVAPPPPTEQYTDYGVRAWVETKTDPLSTFSTDVDTGAYTVVRTKLSAGLLPPVGAVRVEEMVNHFRQDYPNPTQGPFTVLSEAAPSPFRPGKTILRIGLQGKRVSERERKRANLVFLIDVSGSMAPRKKLPLIKKSLRILVDSLRDDDRVAICTYAGRVATVLEPTPARDKATILAAVRRLRAGGSTAMGSGISLAYALAARTASPDTISKVFVFSDGDANVGPVSHHEILATIERHKQKGIFLGTVGFGMGNYKDTMMEQLANKGEGAYAYVDGIAEAERLFGEDVTKSLTVIARDVKLQVQFDKTRVARYRLLGYENRAIHDADFRNDHVDAGEVGAGHTVTALYELELVEGSAGPLGTVSLRYKPAERPAPGVADAASEATFGLTGAVGPAFAKASQRFRITACVGEFAEILRKSPHVKTSFRALIPVIEAAMQREDDDREVDLLRLVKQAAALDAARG